MRITPNNKPSPEKCRKKNKVGEMSADNNELGIFRWFRRLSLRVWLAIGMTAAMLPLVIIMVVGYQTYRSEIARPFEEVLNAQHRVLVPLERIQYELWDIATAVNEFAELGDENYRTAFEETERAVAKQLEGLETAVDDHSKFSPILVGVEQQWGLLLDAAAKVEPGDATEADPNLLRFETVISETAKRVGDLAEDLRIESEASHLASLEAIRRLETFAIFAALVAVLFAGLGIYIIDFALINSTDKLVEGALRIARGDRERKIEVQVPPELASVADAFNVMTSQIIRQENALAEAARTDSLTGLLNRGEFDRLLAAHTEEADAGGGSFALLMLDIDHFKQFNDSHGHLAGDSALRQVAKLIKDAAREHDAVCRYGGEEFALILPGLSGSDAFLAADRVRQNVADQGVFLPDGSKEPMTVSIGVSVYGADDTDPSVVNSADQALYSAKHSGRNAVRVAVNR